MKRLVERTSLRVLDLSVLSLAYWLAFFLRFEGVIPASMWKRLVLTWPYVLGLQYAVLIAFGVPKFSWRFVGLRESARILVAMMSASAVMVLLRVSVPPGPPDYEWVGLAIIPVGVIIIDAVLSYVGLTGIRAYWRLTMERAESIRRRTRDAPSRPTLLVGAGPVGVSVAKEIAARPDLGIRAIGFIDDDAGTGTVIHGISVLGPMSRLGVIAARTGASQALVTSSDTSGQNIRRIHELCEQSGLATKIIPGVSELVDGQVNLSRIRDVAIEDLLRRPQVALDEPLIASSIKDCVVLVTGAGGSIGSELCRQVSRFSPRQLVLVEQAENGLFEIHRELGRTHRGLAITPCVADVCDARRVEDLFARFGPQYVFHAAAHKHVPMMEWNPCEAVKNNLFGTRTVADLADKYCASRFVLVSTDKAINPTSVMGATKRAAEIYVQALSQHSRTRFVAVRFGNVLGSTGSVVPIFKEQIASGGPVTVTHPEMRRYFMTIPEACQLVLQAGAMGEGGEVFVLDMGEPVRIVDLATDLIRLSGLHPDEIQIVFTGLRPGEKLHEELSGSGEDANRTKHPKILVGHLVPHRLEAVRSELESLETLVRTDAAGDHVRTALARLVPEFKFEQSQPAARTQGN